VNRQKKAPRNGGNPALFYRLHRQGRCVTITSSKQIAAASTNQVYTISTKSGKQTVLVSPKHCELGPYWWLNFKETKNRFTRNATNLKEWIKQDYLDSRGSSPLIDEVGEATPKKCS